MKLTPMAYARKLPALLISAFLFSGNLCAQTQPGAVEGRIQDPVSGDYLLNVRVTVKDTGRETFTDNTGYYQIPNMPAGAATLEVFYTGFDRQSATVTIEAGKTTVRDFSMASAARYGSGDQNIVLLDKYVVAATREEDAKAIAINEQRFASNIRNVVAADAFGDVAEGNIGEFMKFIPGVVLDYGAGDAKELVLRGIPSEYVSVMLDGNDIASAASTGSGRAFELEQVSITNASRVEVTKTQTPSMWANALGGSVNLVSKSSFERSKPQFKYRLFATFSSDDYKLEKTGGPGDKNTFKVRPGVELSYIHPVNKNFGYTFSALYSDQYGHERYSAPTWEFRNTYGSSETNPYLRSYYLRDDPRKTTRQTYQFGMDWRPLSTLTLKLNYTYSNYDLFSAVNRLFFQHRSTIRTSPLSYDEHHMYSGTNTTETLHNPAWRSKYGNTNTISGAANWRLGLWKASVEGSMSKSVNYYRDTDEGFFGYTNVRISNVQTKFDNIQDVRPGSITVLSGGNAVDWSKLSSYNIIDCESDASDSTDTRYNVRANLRRDLQIAGMDAAIQIGGGYKKQIRDRTKDKGLWSFRGADGKANTADDNAAGLLNTNYMNKDPGFGWPANIEWIDLHKLYQLYQQHPDDGWFVFNQVHADKENAIATEYIEEMLYAGYVQFEASPFRGRMKLIGGVRYEETEDRGEGMKLENGVYTIRGRRSHAKYHGWYPSAGLNFNITHNLIFRAGWSRTLGRPNFGNIIGTIEISNANETINMRNPNLKPWESENIDLSLEYYLKSSGVISVGAFWKEIKNAFGTFTETADETLLREFDLSDSYRGWEVTTKYNVGTARLSGIEASYNQKLSFKGLPKWLRGFSVFANGTVIDLDGERADFAGFIEKTANWGVSYSNRRFSMRFNWNYRGRQHINFPNFGTDANDNPIIAHAYTLPATRLDANIEYRFNKYFGLFANARNLTNAPLDRVRVSANNPEYSQFSMQNLYGIKFTVGVRGTW